jgi:hypothetical protein
VISREPTINISPLRAELRHYAVRHAAVDTKADFSFFIALAATVAGNVGAIIWTVGWLPEELGTHLATNSIPSLPLPTMAGILLIMACLCGGYLGLESLNAGLRRNSTLLGAGLVVVCAGALWSVAALSVNHGHYQLWHSPDFTEHPDVDTFLLIVFMAASGAALFVPALLAGSALLTLGLFIVPLLARRPEVRGIHDLIDLLDKVTRRGFRIQDVAAKALVCHRLDRIREIIGVQLPRALQLSGPNARPVVQAHFDGVAAFIDQMQVSVALADDSTLPELRESIGFLITALLLGEYAALPVAPVTSPSAASRLRRLSSVLRTVAAGAVPAACVAGAWLAGVPLPRVILTWAIVVALAWAVITLVSVLDPTYRTRLEDLRELISSVRGGS